MGSATSHTHRRPGHRGGRLYGCGGPGPVGAGAMPWPRWARPPRRTICKKLLRASDRVVFSFDGDKAGRRAAWRALQACLPVLRDDINLRFLFLPAEHDPDSHVREFGAEAFRAGLGEAAALSRFLLDELASRHNLGEAEGRAACGYEARPLLGAIPACGLKTQIERELGKLVQLTPEEVAQALAQPVGPPGAQAGVAPAGASPPGPPDRGAFRHGPGGATRRRRSSRYEPGPGRCRRFPLGRRRSGEKGRFGGKRFEAKAERRGGRAGTDRGQGRGRDRSRAGPC